MNVALKKCLEEIAKLVPKTEHISVTVELDRYSFQEKPIIKFSAYTATTTHYYSNESLEDAVDQISKAILAKQNAQTESQQTLGGSEESPVV